MSVDSPPPASLPRDEAHGVYACLVVPWGEPVSEDHETDPGRVYQWGDARQPKGGGDERSGLPVNFDHGDQQVGVVVGTATDRVGLWASVKLGRQGRAAVARGCTAVSAELDAAGVLEGVALVTEPWTSPGFASAQVVVDGFSPRGPDVGFEPPVLGGPSSLLGQMARLADAAGGVVVVNRGGVRGPGPAPMTRPVVDVGAHRAWAESMSVEAAEADAERLRADFAVRQAEAVVAEAERRELRWAACGVPMAMWPAGTVGRRQYDELVALHDGRLAELESEAVVRSLCSVLTAGATVRRRSWVMRVLSRVRRCR